MRDKDADYVAYSGSTLRVTTRWAVHPGSPWRLMQTLAAEMQDVAGILEAERALLDARLQLVAAAKAADTAARPTVEGARGDDAPAEDTSPCDPIIENSRLIGDLREQLAAIARFALTP